MNVTGRPAQFGRGVMVEVGGKLVEQFAANLAKLIAGDTGSGGDAGSGDAGTSAPAGTSDAGTSDAGASDGGSSDAGSSDAGASVAGASGNGASAPAATVDARTGNGSGGAAAAAGPVASTSAPAQEDSLNLVKLVGPVLLKRLVPAVAGAAGLALLSRLLWRLRHRAGRAEKA
jgi:hypothetical protein